MNLLRRLSFSLWYLRRPPWDSGIVPPEVEDFIRNHTAGRALDLGCGTGTSSLALARAGWVVTGVDFTPRAVRQARRKTKAAGACADFLVGDATRLPPNLFTIPNDLVLDVGCFHGLSPAGRSAYMKQLDRLLAPGGIWLMYGFFKPSESPGPGLLKTDLDTALEHLTLIRRRDGTDKNGRPSAWFWYRK